jgi:hypothetical protein
MPGEYGDFEFSSPANQEGSKGRSRTERTGEVGHGPEPRERFLLSDEGTGTDDLTYSGFEPDLIATCHDVYLVKPEVRTKDERRHSRIPARQAQACIRTEDGKSVVVNLLNISRGGACFTSFANFQQGTAVSIATHYIEGGQNIFQMGRIVRVQHRAVGTFPGEYAVEFSLKSTM